jgi:hypothetical protein
MFSVETFEQIEKRKSELQKERFKMFEAHFTQDKIVNDIAKHNYCVLLLQPLKGAIDPIIFNDFAEWFSTKFDTNIFKYDIKILEHSNSPSEIKIYLK